MALRIVDLDRLEEVSTLLAEPAPADAITPGVVLQPQLQRRILQPVRTLEQLGRAVDLLAQDPGAARARIRLLVSALGADWPALWYGVAAHYVAAEDDGVRPPLGECLDRLTDADGQRDLPERGVTDPAKAAQVVLAASSAVEAELRSIVVRQLRLLLLSAGPVETLWSALTSDVEPGVVWDAASHFAARSGVLSQRSAALLELVRQQVGNPGEHARIRAINDICDALEGVLARPTRPEDRLGVTRITLGHGRAPQTIELLSEPSGQVRLRVSLPPGQAPGKSLDVVLDGPRGRRRLALEPEATDPDSPATSTWRSVPWVADDMQGRMSAAVVRRGSHWTEGVLTGLGRVPGSGLLDALETAFPDGPLPAPTPVPGLPTVYVGRPLVRGVARGHLLEIVVDGLTPDGVSDIRVNGETWDRRGAPDERPDGSLVWKLPLPEERLRGIDVAVVGNDGSIFNSTRAPLLAGVGTFQPVVGGALELHAATEPGAVVHVVADGQIVGSASAGDDGIAIVGLPSSTAAASMVVAEVIDPTGAATATTVVSLPRRWVVVRPVRLPMHAKDRLKQVSWGQLPQELAGAWHPLDLPDEELVMGESPGAGDASAADRIVAAMDTVALRNPELAEHTWVAVVPGHGVLAERHGDGAARFVVASPDRFDQLMALPNALLRPPARALRLTGVVRPGGQVDVQPEGIDAQRAPGHPAEHDTAVDIAVLDAQGHEVAVAEVHAHSDHLPTSFAVLVPVDERAVSLEVRRLDLDADRIGQDTAALTALAIAALSRRTSARHLARHLRPPPEARLIRWTADLDFQAFALDPGPPQRLVWQVVHPQGLPMHVHIQAAPTPDGPWTTVAAEDAAAAQWVIDHNLLGPNPDGWHLRAVTTDGWTRARSSTEHLAPAADLPVSATIRRRGDWYWLDLGPPPHRQRGAAPAAVLPGALFWTLDGQAERAEDLAIRIPRAPTPRTLTASLEHGGALIEIATRTVPALEVRFGVVVG